MKTFTIFIMLLTFSITFAQNGFYQLTFEAPGGYTTSTAESSNGLRRYFIRSDGNNIADPTFNNIQGFWYFALQDKDNAPTPVGNPAFLNITAIDISGQTGLVFGVFLAVDNYLSGNAWQQGTDYVHIYYQIDGGGFNNMIWVEPRNTSSEPFIDINFDGTGSSVDGQITDVFTEYTFNIPATGASLDISFEFGGLDGTLDDFAIDRIRVGSDATPLPVELTSFTANVNNYSVILNWETATEINNYGFEIQRASSSTTPRQDGWEKIGFEQGHGNSNSVKNYSYTDYNLTGGSYLYRLKQIDTDGNYEYSNIVEVNLAIEIPDLFNLSQNYPNPFNPATQIDFSLPEATSIDLTIYNTNGEMISTLAQGNFPAGFHTVKFNVESTSGRLPTGIYIYRIVAVSNSKTYSQIRKMILLK